MRIDGPPGTRVQPVGDRILQAVVDIQVQVESLSRDLLEVDRPEMLHFGHLLQGPAAVDAARLRAERIIEDQSDMPEFHVGSMASTQKGLRFARSGGFDSPP